MRTSGLQRLIALVPDREIFMRGGGDIRYLRITTRMQLMGAGVVAMLLGAWLVMTGLMLWRDAALSARQAEIAAARSRISVQA
ncbi:MAG: hypothetical protein ABW048_10640, partial [Sphingobium sp.]